MNPQELKSLKEGISKLIEVGATYEQIRGVLVARGWGDDDIALVLDGSEQGQEIAKISSLPALLSRAFVFTFKNFGNLFPLLFLTSVVSIALYIGVYYFMVSGGVDAIAAVSTSGFLPEFIVLPMISLGLLALFLVFGGLQMVPLASVIGGVLGRRTVFANIGVGIGRAYPLFWAVLLTVFMVVPGLLLFVVPGLIFALWFVFAPVVTVLEKASPFQSLLISRELVRGREAAVAFRFFVFLLMSLAFLVVCVGIATPLTLIGSLSMSASLAVLVGVTAIVSLAALFFTTFSFSFYVLFYKELRSLRPNVSPSRRSRRFLATFLVVVFVIVAALTPLLTSEIRGMSHGRGSIFNREKVTYAEPIRYDDGVIELARKKIFVAIVEDSSELIKGLSDQESIGEDEGLLFDFGEMDRHGIWMRDMNFAIDIIWLDSDWRVVDIKENALPSSFRSVFDAETFTPQGRARYVLEVASGFVEQSGLEVGDRAVLSID